MSTILDDLHLPNKLSGFVYIEGIAFPYPDSDSGLQTIATMVDSARTADGVVRGEKIGRDVGKVEMKWNVLPPEVWSAMLKIWDEHFYFTLRYISMKDNDWVERRFYVGDRTAKPFLIDPVTNKPKYYIECKANVVDVGL